MFRSDRHCGQGERNVRGGQRHRARPRNDASNEKNARDQDRAAWFQQNCPRAPYHGVRELRVEHAGGSHHVVPPRLTASPEGESPEGTRAWYESGVTAEAGYARRLPQESESYGER